MPPPCAAWLPRAYPQRFAVFVRQCRHFCQYGDRQPKGGLCQNVPSNSTSACVLDEISDSKNQAGAASQCGWQRTGLGRHRRNSKALPVTQTELSAIAAPAATGLNTPNIASGIPSTL